jgi:DNA-binding SARP family transcriptional activator/tetratricopeptide (TPR) repeat protein
MFGALTLERDGRTIGVRDFGGKKPRQLLEILLVSRGRSVSKSAIADLLWPEESPRNAHAALESYVSVLRRIVGPDVVVTEQGAYRIDAARIDVDLDRFDAHRARAELDAAIALLRGDVLEHEPYAAWADRIRGTYRPRAVAALVDGAEAALRAGDNERAIVHSDAALVRDATCERAHRTAMSARHSLGRRDEAMAAFERCRAALLHELGVEPAAETIALAASIRRGGELAVRAVPEERSPVGLGTFAREVPFLGRRAELARVEAACRDALAENAAALMLVEGEAGVGKSRLLAELTSQLSCRIGRVKCAPLDASVAFAPLAEALRSLGLTLDGQRFPALGEILPELGLSGFSPETARARAFESLAAVVTQHAPLLLVIDDAQWADPSTLAAIAYVLRRASRVPLLVLCVLRTEDTPADHPLRSLVPRDRIVLEPLSPVDLAPLGIADLHAKTGGNALFVVEYMRGSSEGSVPDTLRDVILARSRAAGPAEHRVLAVSSVLGRTVDPMVLAAVLETDAGETLESLERLTERRLLAARGEHFDFRHDLIRQSLYASLSPARRRYLHRRALDVLEASRGHPNSPDGSADLAWHAEQAGAMERALRWSMRAGDAAHARWANVEAASHYERARRFGMQPDMIEDSAREALLMKLARVFVTLGRGEEARAAIDEARRSVEARGDDAALFDVLEVSCIVLQRGIGSPSASLDQARIALGVAKRLGDAAAVARAHALVGSPAASIGRIDEAIEHSSAAVTVAESNGFAPRANPLGRLALALHFRGREEEALEWCARAETVAPAQGDEDALIQARWVRALALITLGRWSAAWRALDAIAEVGQGEEAFWHARLPNTYGAILAEVGEHARALEHDLESLQATRSRRGQPFREAEMHTLINTAERRLALGRVAEARADLETVRRQVAAIEYARFRWLARFHAVDSAVALAEEDAERARSAADATLGLAEQHGMPKYEVRGRIALARVLAQRGTARRAAARKQAVAAARRASDLGYVPLEMHALRVAEDLGVDGAKRRADAAARAVAAGLDDPLRTNFLRMITSAKR